MTRRSDLPKGTGPTGELGPNPACLFLSEQVPLVWELVQRMEVPFLVFTKALLPHWTLQTATSLLSTTFCFTQWIPVGAAYSYKMCGPCNDEVCEAQNLLLKPHSDFRKLRKIQADSQMRTSDYSFVIYKYLHSVGTTTPTLVLSGEEVTRLLLPLTSKPEQVPVQPRAHWLTVKRTPGSTLWPFEPLCSRKRGKKWQRQNWEHGDKCCQVRTSKHLPC